MMELQSQAPNFAKNEPRVQELKDARRQYNRQDKYTIGQRQGLGIGGMKNRAEKAWYVAQKDFSNFYLYHVIHVQTDFLYVNFHEKDVS